MNMQCYWLQRHKKPLCYRRKPHESICVSGEGQIGGGEKERDISSFLCSELRFVNKLWWNQAVDKSEEPVNLPGGITCS